MENWLNTIAGRDFSMRTIPELTKALNRLSDALENSDCACCTGSGGHNGHCDECIEGPESLARGMTAAEDYYIMTHNCPECKKAWPEGSEFELCEASKLYKRKGYLNRTCDDCGVITFTFWVDEY